MPLFDAFKIYAHHHPGHYLVFDPSANLPVRIRDGQRKVVANFVAAHFAEQWLTSFVRAPTMVELRNALKAATGDSDDAEIIITQTSVDVYNEGDFWFSAPDLVGVYRWLLEYTDDE